MDWQYTVYTPVLFITSISSIGLALYIWPRRAARGAPALAIMALAVAEWSLGYALELGATGLVAKTAWARLQYFGIVSLPVAWLAFADQYIGRSKWLTPRKWVLISIIPFVTLILVWTNESHGLIWSQVKLVDNGFFLTRDISYGQWFWVHSAFSYSLLLFSSFQLITVFLRSPQIYRRQAAALLFGLLMPWISNSLYLSGQSPVPNLDLTPFACLLSAVAFTLALFRFRLLDIVPVARRAVLDGMRTGVLVLDTQNRIVDINLAAQKFLGFSTTEAIGKPVSTILADYRELVERYRNQSGVQTEITLWSDPQSTSFAPTPRTGRDIPHYYDLEISSLTDREGHPIARLVVVHNITRRKRAESQLRAAHARLEQRVQERTAELARANEILQVEIAERREAEKRIQLSLNEKNVLLKEIHHRVKNNLQIISSLLNLQADNVKNPGLIEAIQDSQNRIRSMALLHEKLYRSTDLAQINFAEYIQDLVTSLFRTHRANLQRISLNLQVEKTFLIIDIAMPCGLIITELVTNALKHAFPGERTGELCIKFGLAPDGRFDLIVADNGVGFPADLHQVDSLGLQLVNTLVHQLGGTIEFDHSQGTRVKINFPGSPETRGVGS